MNKIIEFLHNYLGYNIAANFLSKENYIITGSEDNQVKHKFSLKKYLEILQRSIFMTKQREMSKIL